MMIREMKLSDWDDMMEIYKQSIEKCDAISRNDCLTYEKWDAGHLRKYRYVYDLDDKVIGYATIALLSDKDDNQTVVKFSIHVDCNYTEKEIGILLLSKLLKSAEKENYWNRSSVIFSITEGWGKFYERTDGFFEKQSGLV